MSLSTQFDKRDKPFALRAANLLITELLEWLASIFTTTTKPKQKPCDPNLTVFT